MAGKADSLRAKFRGGVLDTPRRIWAHPYTRDHRVRQLGRWLVWQGWQRTVRRPWTVVMHGDVRLVCHPHDMVASMALYHGLYDIEEMSFLLAWLRPGDTFVDVGANDAPYSLLATSLDGVRSVAFEPDDQASGRARVNAELNGVQDRLDLVAAAVGDRDGRALLTDDHLPTSHLVEAGAPTSSGMATREVPILRLDTYDAGEGLGRVRLVKVDAEGHEVAVLRGAAAVLERDRPALVVEVNDPVALGDWIATACYVTVAYDWEAGRLERRELPSRPGGNVILVTELAAAQARLAAGIPR